MFWNKDFAQNTLDLIDQGKSTKALKEIEKEHARIYLVIEEMDTLDRELEHLFNLTGHVKDVERAREILTQIQETDHSELKKRFIKVLKGMMKLIKDVK